MYTLNLNKHTKFLMNKKVFLIIVPFFIIISLIFIVFNQNFKPINIEIEANKELNKKQKIIKYFVPVVGLKSKINNLEYPLPYGQKINILTEDQEDIKNMLGSNYQFNIFKTYEALVSFLNERLNEYGIINFQKLNVTLKAISIDNLFILDKSINHNEYKLKLIKEINLDVYQNTAESNFNPQKLQNIGHVGSLIPARGVDYYIKSKFKGDFKLLFKETKKLFDSIDIMSSTFEAPVLGKGRYCSNCTVFVGDETFVDAVEYSGIDIFSLASNHIMDGGIEGLSNTQRLLKEKGLLYTGASILNNDEAGKPILVQKNGIRIAYLGFNDTPGIEQWATENKGGAANISDWIIDQNGKTIKYEPNEERIKYFLDRAKSFNPDIIVVLMHWGSVEYQPKPTEYTRQLARLLIKHNADVIFGDHPHWVQEIELIENKPIFYSVGNFVFDQTWSIETMQGIIVEIFLYNKKIINYKLHPHQLDLVRNGIIKLLNQNDKEYEQILQRIYNVSNFTFNPY